MPGVLRLTDLEVSEGGGDRVAFAARPGRR
ncbi:MAG: hypothetical protein RLZZ481_1573, partial [Pseudomonadota bacterium]